MSASLTTNNRQPTTMPQRRQPITHAEVEEVRRTGVLPLMTDPVKTGRTPYCSNCMHWEPERPWTGSGRCHAQPGYSTGSGYTCPAHQGYEVITETKTTTP